MKSIAEARGNHHWYGKTGILHGLETISANLRVIVHSKMVKSHMR